MLVERLYTVQDLLLRIALSDSDIAYFNIIDPSYIELVAVFSIIHFAWVIVYQISVISVNCILCVMSTKLFSM